jgi:uncharacterized protein YeaO (DUF488 family)
MDSKSLKSASENFTEYETEIKHHDDLVKMLKHEAREGTVTLVYAARDEKHNEALVLKQFLERSE